MNRIILALVVCSAACVDANAQGAATFHVFPQIADGTNDGQTGYVSALFTTNTSTSPATCTLRLYGSGLASRFFTPTFTLPAQGATSQQFSALNSNVVNFLATGYATLTCDQPVAAAVGYVFVGTAGVLSGATVFSSPPTTRAELQAFRQTRLALALANNTDALGSYQVTLLNSSGQAIAPPVTIQVPARSNLPRFIDEIPELTVPADFTGAVSVTSAAGSGAFSLVGLVFIGNVFFSQPAVTFGP